MGCHAMSWRSPIVAVLRAVIWALIGCCRGCWALWLLEDWLAQDQLLCAQAQHATVCSHRQGNAPHSLPPPRQHVISHIISVFAGPAAEGGRPDTARGLLW